MAGNDDTNRVRAIGTSHGTHRGCPVHTLRLPVPDSCGWLRRECCVTRPRPPAEIRCLRWRTQVIRRQVRKYKRGVHYSDRSNSWSVRRNAYRAWALHVCGLRQHTPSIKWLNPWIASVGSPHLARTTAPSIAMATALAQSSRSQFSGSRPSITLRSPALC